MQLACASERAAVRVVYIGPEGMRPEVAVSLATATSCPVRVNARVRVCTVRTLSVPVESVKLTLKSVGRRYLWCL